MEKAEMKIAPSTPTLSIAATISSPVTWSGQFGTLCQGRFGVFASYTWTWESIIVIGDAPLCRASLAITAGSCPEGPGFARLDGGCLAPRHEHQRRQGKLGQTAHHRHMRLVIPSRLVQQVYRPSV